MNCPRILSTIFALGLLLPALGCPTATAPDDDDSAGDDDDATGDDDDATGDDDDATGDDDDATGDDDDATGDDDDDATGDDDDATGDDDDDATGDDDDDDATGDDDDDDATGDDDDDDATGDDDDDATPDDELCGDGIDNDGDGLTDCDDEDCSELSLCLPSPEDCGNGVDDDEDGATDCDDSDCDTYFACEAPLAGAVIVTEIMNAPLGTDGDQEWFEVYNLSDAPIDLAGWNISDDGADSHTIDSALVVAAGGFAVLGRSTDTAVNGGAAVDYSYGSDIILANGDDEIVLTNAEGTEIDAVRYDGGPDFPDPSGAAMVLNGFSFDGADNDNGSSWCVADGASYGDGGIGTPGAANTACPVDADGDGFAGTSDCDDANADVNPLEIEVAGNRVDDNCNGEIDEETPGLATGSVFVTEYMANPNGLDSQEEWFEVYNPTSDDISLHNWLLYDGDITDPSLDVDYLEFHRISADLVVPAGGYAVLGRSTDTTTNGGAPVDYGYGGDFNLGDTIDAIFLSDPAGNMIDGIEYGFSGDFPDTAGGASTQLSPAMWDSASNDDGMNWCETSSGSYGTGGNGSPGAANSPCEDLDRDGFTTFDDCDDSDPTVNPGAIEVAGNGIDDNCNGEIDEAAETYARGDLIITEFLANPGGTDGDREWFELHNPNAVEVNLLGWSFEDEDADAHTVTTSAVVPPGGYVVVGASFDPVANGGAPVDVLFGGMALANSSDEIIVVAPDGTVADEVIWGGDTGLSNSNAAANQLSSGMLSPDDNDLATNWCDAVSSFGTEGDLGTPGSANLSCGG